MKQNKKVLVIMASLIVCIIDLLYIFFMPYTEKHIVIVFSGLAIVVGLVRYLKGK